MDDHDRPGSRRASSRPRWRRSASPYELFPCDPALADTAAFCAAYGFAPEESANTIVVIGKSDPPRYAACVTLAPYRLDVNRVVRDRLGTRKASFAPAEDTAAITGMQMGGVTVFGLPPSLPIWVDSRVMDRERLVLGGGSRSWKVIATPADPDRAAGGRGRRGPRQRAAAGGLKPTPVSFRPVTDATPPGPPDQADPAADPTPSRRPRPLGPVQYKGDDLEAERGPGLGCFRFQVVILVVFIILTPLSVAWPWPEGISAGLLFAVILLLFLTARRSSSCCAWSRRTDAAAGGPSRATRRLSVRSRTRRGTRASRRRSPRRAGVRRGAGIRRDAHPGTVWPRTAGLRRRRRRVPRSRGGPTRLVRTGSGRRTRHCVPRIGRSARL